MKYVELKFVREKLLLTIKILESMNAEIAKRLCDDLDAIAANSVHILNPTKSHSDKERQERK